MAAKGFIELLRLSERGRRRQQNTTSDENRWSGIAFEMMGQYFVAPLGEVAEVLYVPKFTPVPKTHHWVKGLANIRGRLLSVVDLTAYISQERSKSTKNQKVICIQHKEHYSGVLVDQVFGIQHFNKISFFSKFSELQPNLEKYCKGYFYQHNQRWHVFMLSQLIQDQNYMIASAKN